MQLSDLIKSKIDLYSISFGIGSGNLKKAAKHPRARKISEGTKGKTKNGNTKSPKTKGGKKGAKVHNVPKVGKLSMVKVSKSAKVVRKKAKVKDNVKAKGTKKKKPSKKHVKKRK